MKASRSFTTSAARTLGLLTASVLLVQCSMPPQQAWRYIQSNGLFPYLSSSQHASPPFRSGGAYSQRYAASQPYQRRAPYWTPRTPNRPSYGATNSPGYATNNYFSSPSSGTGNSRYIPRTRQSSPSPEHRPNVKLPVEEPAPAPQITHNPQPAPKTTGSPPAPASAIEGLPYGTAVAGRMNMVNSPFAGKTQLVDVSGMSAGQTVKCPYTGKLFKVPPTQQAANHAESRLESKTEAPKLIDEPKASDKKP